MKRSLTVLVILLGTSLSCGRDQVRPLPGSAVTPTPGESPSDLNGTGGSGSKVVATPLRHPVGVDGMTSTHLFEGSPEVGFAAAAAKEGQVLLVMENEQGLWADLAPSAGLENHALRVSGSKRQLREQFDSRVARLSVLPSATGFAVLENRWSGELTRYDLDASGATLRQVEVAARVAAFSAAQGGELLAWLTPHDGGASDLMILEGETAENVGSCYLGGMISLASHNRDWALAASCALGETYVIWQKGSQRVVIPLPSGGRSAPAMRLTETELLVAAFEWSSVSLLAIDFAGNTVERSHKEFPPESIANIRGGEFSADGSQLLLHGGEPTLGRGKGDCHLAMCRASQDAIDDCRRVYSNDCGGGLPEGPSWISGDGPPIVIGALSVESLYYSTIRTFALCDAHEGAALGVHTEGIADPEGVMGTQSGAVQGARPLGVSFTDGVPATLVYYEAGTTEWLQGQPLAQTGSSWEVLPGPDLSSIHAYSIGNDWYASENGEDVRLTVGQPTMSPLPSGMVPPYTRPSFPHDDYVAVTNQCAGRYYAADRSSEAGYQLVALDPQAALSATKWGDPVSGSNVYVLCDHRVVVMGLDRADMTHRDFYFYDHEGVFLGSQSFPAGVSPFPEMSEGLLLLAEPDHLLIVSPKTTLPIPLLGRSRMVVGLDGEHLVVFWHDQKRDLIVTEGRVVLE